MTSVAQFRADTGGLSAPRPDSPPAALIAEPDGLAEYQLCDLVEGSKRHEGSLLHEGQRFGHRTRGLRGDHALRLMHLNFEPLR